MTMTDEKYDRVETACDQVVTALALETAGGASTVDFADLDPVKQNDLRVQLAEIYSLWEEQWALEQNNGKRKLGKQKL